jgi:hypothetical protein
MFSLVSRPNTTILAYTSNMDTSSPDSIMSSQHPHHHASNLFTASSTARDDPRGDDAHAHRRTNHIALHDQQASRAMHIAETYRHLHGGSPSHKDLATPPQEVDEPLSPEDQHTQRHQRRLNTLYLSAVYSPYLQARDVVKPIASTSTHTPPVSYSTLLTPCHPNYYGPEHQIHRRPLPSASQFDRIPLSTSPAPSDPNSMVLIEHGQFDAVVAAHSTYSATTPYESHWDRFCRVVRQCVCLAQRI